MTEESKFLALEVTEIESKLRELLFSRQPLKIWRDSSQFARVELISFQEQKIKVEQFDFYSNEETYFVSFCLRGINYYFRASADVENNHIMILPIGSVFRAERRRSVRLMMYPRITGFLYFQFEESPPEVSDNVLSLNRSSNEEKKFLKLFQEELKDTTKIGGVKILDISEEGLSFTTSQKDANLISTSKPRQAIAVVDGKSVAIENLEYIYNVDYLNQRLEGIGFKKIGVKFSKNLKLEDLLKDLNDNSMVLTSLDEEFASFIGQIGE